VGVSIAQQSLAERDFSKYSAISMFPEEVIDSEQALATLRAGEYACIYCRSALFDSAQYYRQLLDYIAEQGYGVDGDSVERIIIDQFITNNQQKHLSSIQVPVKKIRE
jgi:effector-binding domain-containing protein